jgi:hypothetical protein
VVFKHIFVISGNSSIYLAAVTPDKRTSINSYFWDGHKISAADTMHSFINSLSGNGFDLVAVFFDTMYLTLTPNSISAF